MRTPRTKQVLNPKTGRYRTVYYGSFRYRGKQYWVPGTYETAKAWERAADEIKVQVDRELEERAIVATSGPTLAEFAGARFDERSGRLTTAWPWSHPRRRRTKESSLNRAAEAIRPLIREFGDRRADEIRPDEAYAFLRARGRNTRDYSAQFFDDLLRLHPVAGVTNPFRGHDLPVRRRRPRKADAEFRILSDEEYHRLIETAGAVRDDDYRLVQQALVIAMGTSCARPSELLALRYERPPVRPNGVQPAWIDLDRDLLHITSQLDRNGNDVLPKDNETRTVVLPPPMKQAILAMPRISEFVYPALRGERLTIRHWDGYYWPVIRAAFGDPTLEFYELKHRAITWCCTPVASGGLGLDPATVAHQAGHSDGGLTIMKYYLKLDETLALDRIRAAMVENATRTARDERRSSLRLLRG